MTTPERSGTSQEGDPETRASGAQLVRREDLQDLVQSLVQRALADGGARQSTVTGDNGERPGKGCWNARRLGSLAD